MGQCELRLNGVLGSSDAVSCIASGAMPLALRRAHSGRGGVGCSGDKPVQDALLVIGAVLAYVFGR
jgi:hypothetical protein